MATAVFEFAKTLDGRNPPELLKATAGAAVTKGAPLVWSSGKLVEATGGANTGGVVGVAAVAASADGDSISYYPALPNVMFKTLTSYFSTTPALGALYGLAASTLHVNVSNTTQVRCRVIEGPDAETKYGVVFNGWLTV